MQCIDKAFLRSHHSTKHLWARTPFSEYLAMLRGFGGRCYNVLKLVRLHYFPILPAFAAL